MSLSLHDIERSIGVDLLRRPFLVNVTNASLLRLFLDVFLSEPCPPVSPWYVHVLAALLAIVTHVIALFGILETLFWLILSIVFQLVRATRIYAFEKLVLDFRLLFSKSIVRYIDKEFVLSGLHLTSLPHMRLQRHGLGPLCVSVLRIDDALSRDAVALFKLLRYINRYTISYYEHDTMVFIGPQSNLLDPLLDLSHQPLHLDLGYHTDVLEGTIFHITLHFCRQASPAHVYSDTDIHSVGTRRIHIRLHEEATTESLELVAHCMDQFASVCEAGSVGYRQFNGKRFSVYLVGFILVLVLIGLYEEETYWRPNVDALTLAVGAFTLWMTVGQSAALGPSEEAIELDVIERRNFLLAYHGLAEVDARMRNICWMPESYRPSGERQAAEKKREGKESEGGSESSWESSEEEDGKTKIVDGSISVFEAATCLSVVQHYGHFVKWRGRKLVMERYVMKRENEKGQVHVEAVERVDDIQQLEKLATVQGFVDRIGGCGRGRRRRGDGVSVSGGDVMGKIDVV